MAERIAGFPAGAVQGIKAVARRWRDHDLDASIRYYQEVNAAETQSAEMIDRVTEFFGSRPSEAGGRAGPA